MRFPIIGLCLLLAGCASGRAEFLRRPEHPVGWPPGAERPIVEVLFAYGGTGDARRERSGWRRFLDVLTGEEDLHLSAPYGLIVTDRDELLVADPGGGCVHRISLETARHERLEAEGPFALETPVGVAVDRDGRIFVSDSSAGRIVRFSPGGRAEATFGEGQGRPTGIAWDAVGERLLVTDTTGGRLLSFSPEGELLAAIGRPGSALGLFNRPTNVAVAPSGEIYVTDSMNFRVQVFDSALRPIRAFGVAGDGPGAFSKPKGIALDGDGHVYVVDGMFDNVQVFDPEGNLLLTFGGSGNGLGQLYLPTGIWIDSRNRIFVSESGNARVQVFRYLGGPS